MSPYSFLIFGESYLVIRFTKRRIRGVAGLDCRLKAQARRIEFPARIVPGDRVGIGRTEAITDLIRRRMWNMG